MGRAPEGAEGLAAVPVGGGGAWPAQHSTEGATGVEGAGGTGGHGRASRRGAERSEALASRAAGASGARNTRGSTSNAGDQAGPQAAPPQRAEGNPYSPRNALIAGISRTA
ncbi:hypothetical protein BCA91_24145, partial [Salmonella enterica subsp. enterica serovar Enteritidis]